MRDAANPSIHRRYEIKARAPHLGGGWYVHGFENNVEVAQGVFAPDQANDSHQAARL